MSAIIVSGTELSKAVLKKLKSEVEDLVPLLGRKPRLAVILVGEDPASRVYVDAKAKKAKNIGLETIDLPLPASITDQELQGKIEELCGRSDIDGILLQLPLPNGLNEYKALTTIDPKLDVDGLHPLNQGLLLRGTPTFRPCTPKGIMALIDKAFEDLGRSPNLAGLNAVVVGRSVLVGKPLIFLLLERHCTVTVCHSRTKDLAQRCSEADILVAAVGKAELVQGDWIKPGAVVIDVGINRTDEGKLVGDVAFESVCEMAGAVTPVPGGVGPMTIAMLLANTVESAKRKIGQ